MKVIDLINRLKDMPEDLEVWVYDAYEGVNYHGDFVVSLEMSVDPEQICVVQVGRTMVD